MSNGLPGRPRHEPTSETRKMVEVLAGFGIPLEKIADTLGLTIPTVRRAYKTELRQGYAKVEASMIGNLVRLAAGKDGTALKAIMFTLCCRFGWSQYAPPRDLELKAEKPGKKETADLVAQTAHEDDPAWNRLLN